MPIHKHGYRNDRLIARAIVIPLSVTDIKQGSNSVGLQIRNNHFNCIGVTNAGDADALLPDPSRVLRALYCTSMS